jgi:hypothetical protein
VAILRPAPRGWFCPLGEMFTPSFSPMGEHFLLFRRMEGRTENFTPRGQSSLLGENFALGGKTLPLGADLIWASGFHVTSLVILVEGNEWIKCESRDLWRSWTNEALSADLKGFHICKNFVFRKHSSSIVQFYTYKLHT